MPTQLQNKPKIGFDTNMLMAIGQHGIDIFLEVEKMFGKKAEYAIPEQAMQELQTIKEKKPARIALEEIKKHQVKTMQVNAPNADQALSKMATEGYTIATNDAALRKRIKGFGGKVIYLRQLRFLEQE